MVKQYLLLLCLVILFTSCIASFDTSDSKSKNTLDISEVRISLESHSEYDTIGVSTKQEAPTIKGFVKSGYWSDSIVDFSPLSIVVRSNIDGIIAKIPCNSDGSFSFPLPDITDWEHHITCIVEKSGIYGDSLDFTVHKYIDAVGKLDSLGLFQLHWNSEFTTDIKECVIRRSRWTYGYSPHVPNPEGGDPICTLYSSNETHFTDSFFSLNAISFYSVEIRTNDDRVLRSNTIMHPGCKVASQKYGSATKQLHIDTDLNIVTAVNNRNGGIYLFKTGTDTTQKRLLYDKEIRSSALLENEHKLYVTHNKFSKTIIYEVDLKTETTSDSFEISDENVSMDISESGTLFCYQKDDWYGRHNIIGIDLHSKDKIFNASITPSSFKASKDGKHLYALKKDSLYHYHVEDGLNPQETNVVYCRAYSNFILNEESSSVLFLREDWADEGLVEFNADLSTKINSYAYNEKNLAYINNKLTYMLTNTTLDNEEPGFIISEFPTNNLITHFNCKPEDYTIKNDTLWILSNNNSYTSVIFFPLPSL